LNSTINHKNLTFINVIIVGYFLLIYAIYKFEVDYKIIGVLVELLTIPFLIAQGVFLFLGIRFLLKGDMKFWYVLSFMALMVCAYLTIGSFFT